VHADEKLASLIAHLRDSDVQIAGFVDLPIADGQIERLGVVDRLNNDVPWLAFPMIARRRAGARQGRVD